MPSIFDGASNAASPQQPTRSDLGFIDQVIWGLGGVARSPHNVCAVALHGVCPPGSFALLCPADQADRISQALDAIIDPLPRPAVAPLAILQAMSTSGGSLSGLTILYPGDVVRFPRPVANGVAVLQVIGSTFAGKLLYPTLGETSMVRFYLADPGPITRIGYLSGTLGYAGSPDASAPIPGGGLDQSFGLPLPPDARSLSLYFYDPTSNVRLGASSNTSLAVWFRPRTPNGTWSHHPADDLVAGARGAITEQHDSEVYDLAPGAWDMFTVVKLSGNDVHYRALATR